MKIKRSKFERGSRFPTASPPPADTDTMAASGVEINRGNSNLQPLAPKGHEQANELASDLVKKGGLDSVVTSTAKRAEQTAAPIEHAMPGLPVTKEPNAESWAQGTAEGQPKALVRDQINRMIRKTPAIKIPGQGSMSSKPGESFDQFRMRYLPAIRGVMQQLAHDPSKRIGVVTHSSGGKLIKAWLKKGTPDDFSVDIPTMAKDAKVHPAGVEHLFPNEKGQWQLSRIDMKSDKPLPPSGIFIIEHGVTPSSQDAHTGMHDAIAKIHAGVQAMDFPGVHKYVQGALRSKAIGEDEASAAIDRALPSPEEAAKLPAHHLLAVASAASPEHRKSYEHVMHARFGNLSGLGHDERKALGEHLGVIGYGGSPQNPPTGG